MFLTVNVTSVFGLFISETVCRQKIAIAILKHIMSEKHFSL